LDAQIQATLDAIRSKDPRVYDQKTTFYTADESQHHGPTTSAEPKAKPMYLSDYHRRNLLQGDADLDKQVEIPPTYAQQQDNLRQTVVKEMHAAGHDMDIRLDHAAENRDDEDFLIRKFPPSRKATSAGDSMKHTAGVDPEAAEKDPERFLSNFMSAKAWVPSAASKFQPFESDDEDDDRRAEAFEEAYNLRFEDPKGANEKLLSHARDVAVKYSVRKETTNSRRKARESERAKKEAEKREREAEKGRLRKLRIADAEEKIKRIKDAAGLRDNATENKDWSALLSEGWDNDRWEEEMRKKFGDEYYADHTVEIAKERRKAERQKMKKPKWEDDIEINDLIPEFELEEEILKYHLSITEEESDDESPMDHSGDVSSQQRTSTSGLGSKDIRKRKDEIKKEARKQRREIEQVVDERFALDDKMANFGTKHAGHFRYRETSPLAYGLTSHDILLASDGQLNQFVGLKKLAAFRDVEKKKRDKKRLGKKARLRQWRKETFGDEKGPQETTGEVTDSTTMRRPSSGGQTKEIKRREKPKRRPGKGKPPSTGPQMPR
jgi:protein KRI1